MFGLAAATYVMCDIAGRPQEPFPNKPPRKMYERVSALSELEALKQSCSSRNLLARYVTVLLL